MEGNNKSIYTGPPEPVILLTREQLEKLVEETVDQVMKRRATEILEQVDRIKLDKEILRQALIKAGYAIPEGLNMAQWVPYIEGRDCKSQNYDDGYVAKINPVLIRREIAGEVPQPITYEQLKELMKERDEREHPK